MGRAPKPAVSPLVLRLSFACELQASRKAADEVRVFLQHHGCPRPALADCELALVEACTNAVRHADAKARQLPLGIEATLTRDVVELRVTDHTPGFEWPKSPGLPPPHEETGRGLYLIDQIMDEKQYRRGKQGNVLTLRRKLTKPQPC